MSGLGMGISAGTNLVGGTMQAIASQLAARDMFNAYNKELSRQRGYAQQAQSTLLPYLESWGNAEGDIAKGAAERSALYNSLYGIPLGVKTGGQPSLDRAAYSISGQNRANLGGYGDWMFGQGLGEMRNQQSLADIIDQARGQAGVFPYRMYGAQHSQDELAFWGQLIQSLGGTAGNYASLFGGSGAPPPPPRSAPSGYNMPGVFEPPNYGY